MYIVQLLVQTNWHDTPTDTRFFSAVLVTLAPLLRRLALHMTKKHLRYLDDELESGQPLSRDSSVPEITLVQSESIPHRIVEDPEKYCALQLSCALSVLSAHSTKHTPVFTRCCAQNARIPARAREYTFRCERQMRNASMRQKRTPAAAC